MDTKVLSNPVLKAFVAGSLSGTCSIILFQPLDLIKTRLQVAGAAISFPAISSKSGVAVNSTMYTIIRSIIQNESFCGLWRGSAPSFYRCVPGVGTYFSSLHWLKSKLFVDREPSGMESLLLGSGARSFASVCVLPMTVIKTRFESGKFCYRTISEAVFSIKKIEGVRGLYRGILATLLRDAPFSGLYLMSYNTTKALWPEGGAFYNFGCGVVSGAFASFISQPADVIKTKMQVAQSPSSTFAVATEIYKKDGVYGYFRGIVPRLVRRTLMAAMAWSVYEQISKLLNL